MAATNLNGTPIPTNADIGDSLEALFKAPRLEIERIPQEQDAWCYAACAEMAIKALIPNGFDSVSQCEVASFVKRDQVASCCPPTPGACLTSGCTEDQVGEIFLKFGVDYTGSFDPEFVIPQITTNEIRSEIGDEQPIEVEIRWSGSENSSHVVLITGIRDDDYVFITDPLRGVNYNGWQPYQFVRHGFGEGEWVRTWKGLHRA